MSIVTIDSMGPVPKRPGPAGLVPHVKLTILAGSLNRTTALGPVRAAFGTRPFETVTESDQTFAMSNYCASAAGCSKGAMVVLKRMKLNYQETNDHVVLASGDVK